MDFILDVVLVKEFLSRFCDYGSIGVEFMFFEGFIEEMCFYFLFFVLVCV